MVKKSDMVPGFRVVVNAKDVKWNTEMGVTKNGLHCWKHNPLGHKIGDAEAEAPIGHLIEIVEKVKRRKNGSTVLFRFPKLSGIEHMVFAAFWCGFRHKVDPWLVSGTFKKVTEPSPFDLWEE